MRAMAQWWAAPTRRTMFARDMHARVRRQARPCQRLPWESRARVSSRPVRRQELDGCRARSTTAVKPRSRVDASRRTFCHHLHESVQCTHWPDAGPRRLNRAPSQADLALLRQVTPAGASLGETASAVPTAGWKYLARANLTGFSCEERRRETDLSYQTRCRTTSSTLTTSDRNVSALWLCCLLHSHLT